MTDVTATWGLEDVPWVHSTSRLRALEFDFAVRTADAGLGRYLDRIFGSLAVPGSPAHLYSLVDPDHAPFKLPRLFLDSEEIFAANEFPWVVEHLLWHINRQVVERSSSYLLLHSSAVERDGSALLFPASMESGKTTLAAGMVRAGLRYVTDEAVAIAPATGVVHPFPKALAVDPGSWSTLADFRPPVDAGLEWLTASQWQVSPAAIRSDAVAGPCRPVLIASPRYVAGARTELLPLGRADAVVMLIENAFNFSVHGGRGLELLANMARACACFRLTIGDLDEACLLLLGALDSLP